MTYTSGLVYDDEIYFPKTRYNGCLLVQMIHFYWKVKIQKFKERKKAILVSVLLTIIPFNVIDDCKCNT